MKSNLLLIVAGLAAVGTAQKAKVSKSPLSFTPRQAHKARFILTLQKVFLGDSITEITCWRPLVWTELADANLTSSIQLVGSMNGAAACKKPPGFDAHHEGHSGIQANEVVTKIAGWVQNTRPDVVQFMLGTNDVNIGKKDDKSIVNAYTSILKSIRAANPKVYIIVSSSREPR